MTQQPSVTAGVLLGYESFLSKRGLAARELFERSGLCPIAVRNPQTEIPAQAVAELWEEAARVSQNPQLAYDWAAAMPVGAIGPMFYLFMNSRTVGAAMETLAEHSALLRQAVELKFEADDSGARIWWRWPRGFDGPYTQASIFSAALFVERVRLVTSSDWTPSFVELQGEPLINDDRARWVFGPKIVYGAWRNAIFVDPETANLPIMQANPKMREMAQALCRQAVPGYAAGDPFAIEVQRIIRVRMSERGATLEEVAREVGCSPRTLQNRLAQFGMSFENVLNDIRRTSAEDMLRLGGVSMTQIANKLGFSELSAFTRAAQRWFGMSPTAYRKRLGR